MNRNPFYNGLTLLCVLALVAVVGSPTFATETDGEAVDLVMLDLETVLSRFQASQKKTKTMVAEFTQRKSSSLLANEETASGRVYYSQPDKFVWEYSEPDETVLLINGDTMQTWYKDLNKAQRINIASKKKKAYRFLAIGEEVKKLKETFLITMRAPAEDDPEGSIHLELVPRRRRVRDKLSKVEMWLDGTHFLPIQLRYEQKGGDYTVFSLNNLQPNKVIEEGRFSLDLPEDVDVDETLSRPSRQKR